MGRATTWFHYILLIFTLIAMTTACHRGEAPKAIKKNSAVSAPASETSPGGKFKNYTETGDLAAIKKRGIIRFVLVYRNLANYSSKGSLVQSHYRLAEKLAKRLNLKPHFMLAESPNQAIEMIINGQADVITDNVAETEERKEKLSLTEPLTQTQRVLYTGKNGPDISNLKNLKNVQLTVLANSVLAKEAHKISKKKPSANITVRELPIDELSEEFLDTLDSERPIVGLIGKNTAESLSGFMADMKIGATVGEKYSIVWAVRKDAPKLLADINNFLTQTIVQAQERRKTDWSSIKKSGVLRFATHNGPGYFLWKGVLAGLDYELISKFADKHGLELQVISVPYDTDLIELLNSGEADVAGASTTITHQRLERGVEFSSPILQTEQRVLSHKGSPPINSPQELSGRTLTLREGSAFIATAKFLRDKGIDVDVQILPKATSFNEILTGVAEGKFDATLEDANLSKAQILVHENLIEGAIVSERLPQGWMVAKGNKKLLRSVNDFLQNFLSSEAHKKWVLNYFEPDRDLTQKLENVLLPGGELSPYDGLVKKYAAENNFDWRLVVAQMWQESNFDPKAESSVGAQGLLQVMPQTAQEMGFDPPLLRPEEGIDAGVTYLNWVRARFSDKLPVDERLWFSLAAYNAGIGHLNDARLLAKKLGLNPDKWVDNVEVAMLKLSEPRYFEKARYGYARGAEPVIYVRNISRLYNAYTDVATGDISRSVPLILSPWVITKSALSCRYGCWTPSACAPLPLVPAGRLRRSADGFFRLPVTATPFAPATGRWPPLLPRSAAAGSSP